MEKTQKEKKEWFKTRDILWYLVFTGFAVNYMMRINLNIAIVSMVRNKPKSDEALTSECLANITENDFSQNSNDTQSAYTKSKNLDTDSDQKFDWDEHKQGLVLGSFFWLHWVTQIPGGILAHKYGTKLVFGLSNFTGLLCCFLMPTAAYLGYYYLTMVRALQGLLCGFAWPAMHNMTARWIPPNERSKFVTAYLGSSVGAALTFPMCGFIIDRWGWELVFYVSGLLGCLWYFAWYTLVFDSPTEHPRISESEKHYIVESLGQSVAKKQEPVPWKALLTSLPVWMNVIAQWGGLWGLFTLMTHAPTYFKLIHGWNIKATGLLSGMPHILRMVWAYLFSQFGDYLLKSNKMSRTNVRKLATAVCCIGQGCCLLGLAYSGCDYLTAIIFLTAATAVHGAVSTGPLASVVDISPNYASVSLGFCNTVGAAIGFLTPLLTGHLTYQNQTIGQWQKVFWVAAAMTSISGIFYVLFSKSELQSWNSPSKKSTEGAMESEMVTLKMQTTNGDVDDKNDADNNEYKKIPLNDDLNESDDQQKINV